MTPVPIGVVGAGSWGNSWWSYVRWPMVHLPYIKNTGVFKCPSDKLNTIGSLSGTVGNSYSVLTGTQTKDDGGSDTPIASDDQANTNHSGSGVNVYFADGHGNFKSKQGVVTPAIVGGSGFNSAGKTFTGPSR